MNVRDSSFVHTFEKQNVTGPLRGDAPPFRLAFSRKCTFLMVIKYKDHNEYSSTDRPL